MQETALKGGSMSAKRPQTFAERARELAVKERRDLKRARKAEAGGRRSGCGRHRREDGRPAG